METKLALREQVRRFREERADWYLRGITDVLDLIDAYGLDETRERLSDGGTLRHADGTEQKVLANPSLVIWNAEHHSKRARTELKQRAEDAALVERIAPLLEERFQKKAKRG